ncbi:MAG TPA: DMT family transporter [Burkholderiales bacterium]|nr:DMT family transporter [Burkholderiales bacterium]
MPPWWLWIPITIAAAAAQTLRNATQRHLSSDLGTLGATLVRFLYGLPFAALWLLAVSRFGDYDFPALDRTFGGWLVLGAFSQIAGTALLLRTMREQNFTLGVAYSKSEVMQVAVFGFVFLGDPLASMTVAAVVLGTLGVMLLTPVDRRHPIRTLIGGLATRPALLGLASGGSFALSAVGYRGAALALDAPFLIAAAVTLLGAQLVQTTVMSVFLRAYRPGLLTRILRAWRTSLLAGFSGATASAGWFTAMAIEPVAHVRTLALVELLFSYVISRRIFGEQFGKLQIVGLAVLIAGLFLVTLGPR